MKSRSLSRFGLFAVAAMLAAGPAPAPPPPPPPPNPTLAGPVDGYDMQVLFSVWVSWIARQQGAAIERALIAETPAARSAAVSPIATADWNGDEGLFAAVRIALDCSVDERLARTSAPCRTRYLRARIAAEGQDRDHIIRWARAAFDPKRLAAHLRAMELGPDTDFWLADKAILFSALPAPATFFDGKVAIARMSAEGCPTMAAALGAIGNGAPDRNARLMRRTADPYRWLPSPHATIRTHRLFYQTDDFSYTITNNGVASPLTPVLDAADACIEAGTADEGRR